MTLMFYGDPHGSWEPLRAAVASSPPAAVIILGDCDLLRPIHHELAEIFQADVQVLFIHGNHENDSSDFWDHLVEDHPKGHLHGRVSRTANLDVGGLGGVFKKKIWLPPSEPVFETRAAFVGSLRHQQRWRRWVPLQQRDAIFPEDVAVLGRMRADILVCHEAPSTHRFGFPVIDELATRIKVRLVVHGHHHTSSDHRTAGGIRVVGLAKAEVFRPRPR